MEGFLSLGRSQVGYCPSFCSGSSLNFPLKFWMYFFVLSEKDSTYCRVLLSLSSQFTVSEGMVELLMVIGGKEKVKVV